MILNVKSAIERSSDRSKQRMFACSSPNLESCQPLGQGFVHGFRRNHIRRGDHSLKFVRGGRGCYGGIPASGFADTTLGPVTKLNVRVKAPEAAHVVSVGKVKAWLDRVGKSPGEQVEKNRLK